MASEIETLWQAYDSKLTEIRQKKATFDTMVEQCKQQ
jgi:hypothetical protein